VKDGNKKSAWAVSTPASRQCKTRVALTVVRSVDGADAQHATI